MLNKERVFSLLALPGILFLFLSGTSIQSPAMNGSIPGQVIDAYGNPLEKVSLTLKGKYYQIEIITDDRGSFSARHIPVGAYSLATASLDSLHVTQETLVVHLGKDTKAMIVVRPGGPPINVQGGQIAGPQYSVDVQGRIVRQETIIEDKVFIMQYSYDEKGNLISADGSSG